MTTKRCQKCKHFNGFDGVGELWTLCSLGDFMGSKPDCSSFERKVLKVDLLKKIRELERKVDEQQATISQLKEENKELGKNFDDIVKWASEIAKRNVELDEQIGQLQRENEQLKEEEKLYAQEILRLNRLLKQYQSFKDLGGDY